MVLFPFSLEKNESHPLQSSHSFRSNRESRNGEHKAISSAGHSCWGAVRTAPQSRASHATLPPPQQHYCGWFHSAETEAAESPRCSHTVWLGLPSSLGCAHSFPLVLHLLGQVACPESTQAKVSYKGLLWTGTHLWVEVLAVGRHWTMEQVPAFFRVHQGKERRPSDRILPILPATPPSSFEQKRNRFAIIDREEGLSWPRV